MVFVGKAALKIAARLSLYDSDGGGAPSMSAVCDYLFLHKGEGDLHS